MVEPFLKTLVAAKSPSREEKPAADLLEQWWSTQGFNVLRQGHNLAVLKDSGMAGPCLMLCSHHDTVPATSAWSRPPWEPALEQGKLYGLGANDAKASVVAMALAVQAVQPACGKLLWVSAAEEETGRGGLEVFLPRLLQHTSIDSAIIGEPTGLNIATAQSGLLVLDCVVAGKAGHAARPWQAENPIYPLARDLLALQQLHLDRTHPLLGSTSLAVTMVQAGERHNVIPAEARYTVDIRPTPAYSAQELTELVQSRVQARVSVRSDRFRPMQTPPDAAILKSAQKARPEARLFASPTLSDWAHLGTIPAIKWGPGLSELSHTADEWVELAMVEAAVGCYHQAIEQFFMEFR
jgi:acetylornithine deacetylase